MKTKLNFSHVGKHSYYDPSKGTLSLLVEVETEEAASFFGCRLAEAMSTEDYPIEFESSTPVTEDL